MTERAADITISDIQVLRVGSEDVVIVRPPIPLTQAQTQAVTAALANVRLPNGAQWLVAWPGFRFDIISGAADAAAITPTNTTET